MAKVRLKAGGKTLDFIPFACAHRLPDKNVEAKCVAAMEAFSAPYSMMLLEIDSVGMYDTAAEDMGKVFVSTELGGGGISSVRSNAIAKRGIQNVLIHSGILRDEVQRSASIMLDMPSNDCFTFSEHEGLFEICADLARGANRRCSRPISREDGRDSYGPSFSGADQDGRLHGGSFHTRLNFGPYLARAPRI